MIANPADNPSQLAKLRALAEEMQADPDQDPDLRALAEGFLFYLQASRDTRRLLVNTKHSLTEAAGYVRTSEPESEIVQEFAERLAGLRDEISDLLDS